MILRLIGYLIQLFDIFYTFAVQLKYLMFVVHTTRSEQAIPRHACILPPVHALRPPVSTRVDFTECFSCNKMIKELKKIPSFHQSISNYLQTFRADMCCSATHLSTRHLLPGLSVCTLLTAEMPPGLSDQEFPVPEPNATDYYTCFCPPFFI